MKLLRLLIQAIMVEGRRARAAHACRQVPRGGISAYRSADEEAGACAGRLAVSYKYPAAFAARRAASSHTIQSNAG